MIPFTLKCGGVEKSLADWGIDDLEYNWENLAPHYVTFTIGGRAIDAASIFPYGATVEVWQGRTAIGVGGKRWFYGRVEPWELAGVGGDVPTEDQIGRLVNPWWYLERLIYQMTFTLAPGVPFGAQQLGAGNTYTTPRVVLNVAYDPVNGWKFLTTGQQIAAALQWAISQGAPIQIGNLAPWASPATDFQKGITCAQVIQKMWQIESDFVVVWDYSTMPYPTVHFLKGNSTNLVINATPGQKQPRSQNAAGLLLTPVNINLSAGNWLDKVHIKPRPDWQKSYVRIFYDQISSVNQSQYLSLGLDAYPNPLPVDTESLFRGVDLFYDLAGARVSQTLEEEIITSAAFDITSVAQWKTWKQELNAANVASVVILGASTTPPSDTNHPAAAIACLDTDNNGNPVAYNVACAFELADGMYHDWMTFAGQKVRATAWAFITYKAAAGQKARTLYKQLTYEFTAIALNTVNVPTTVWTFSQTIQSYAEAQPYGVAQAIYQAWQALAAEGSISSVEQELSGVIGFNTCLNFITPNQPAWANLNAVVQSVSGSALKGTTTVWFGAPLHITPAQLMDLVRVSRFRVPSLNLAYLFGGALNNGGGTVRHPRKSHKHSSEGGADHKITDAVYGSANPDTETNPQLQGQVLLNPLPSAAMPNGEPAPLFQLSADDVAAIENLNSPPS